jgi:hypothetical protein
MISEICHQIGRYQKTEALKTKINTERLIASNPHRARSGGYFWMAATREWSSQH